MPVRKPVLALLLTAVVLGTGGAAAQPLVVAPLRYGGIAADPRAPDGIASLPSGPHAAARQLTLPNGGSAWGGAAGEAWTAETAFFALYDAACGDHAGAGHWLDWLAAHRTGYGSLPEQVNARGQPASVAPLAWTDAIVLLALVAQRHPLPMP
jgi:hypothetical protein